MKKITSCFLAIITIFYVFVPQTAFATGSETQCWQDILLTETEFNDIIEEKGVEEKGVEEKATGLIATYSLGIKKSGSNLIIAGTTDCFLGVVKCGFKELVIQRRANSTQEWVDYVTYEDLYDEDTIYVLSKSITVGTGYQYRVTAVHYAKKNIFITQKVNNTSNTVVFA